MSTLRMFSIVALGSSVACTPPPQAPQGLDAATSYLVRNFYVEDTGFEAGIQGFMDWYDAEGYLLVDTEANGDNTSSFIVDTLSEGDVVGLPLDAELLVDPSNEEYAPRDLSRAAGVVSLSDMQCQWTDAEQLLVRPDQHHIFSSEFEDYDRDYIGDRTAFEEASSVGEFDPIVDALNPFADEFEIERYQRSILRTVSMPDPSKVLTSNIEAYPMHLDLRHGVFDLEGREDVGAVAILTWTESAAWGSAGENALLQSYSVEVNIQTEEDTTLRMLAVWTEPKGGGIQPHSALALNFAVNKSLKSSQRLSEICAGEIDVEPEG